MIKKHTNLLWIGVTLLLSQNLFPAGNPTPPPAPAWPSDWQTDSNGVMIITGAQPQIQNASTPSVPQKNARQQQTAPKQNPTAGVVIEQGQKLRKTNSQFLTTTPTSTTPPTSPAKQQEEDKTTAFFKRGLANMKGAVNNTTQADDDDDDDEWEDDQSTSSQELEEEETRKKANEKAAEEERKLNEKIAQKNREIAQNGTTINPLQKEQAEIAEIDRTIQQETQTIKILSRRIGQAGFDIDKFTDENGTVNLTIDINNDSDEDQDAKKLFAELEALNRSVRERKKLKERKEAALEKKKTNGNLFTPIITTIQPSAEQRQQEMLEFLHQIQELYIIHEDIDTIINWLIESQAYSEFTLLNPEDQDLLTHIQRIKQSFLAPSSSSSSWSSSWPSSSSSSYVNNITDPAIMHEINTFMQHISDPALGITSFDAALDYLQSEQEYETYTTIDLNDAAIIACLKEILRLNGLS